MGIAPQLQPLAAQLRRPAINFQIDPEASTIHGNLCDGVGMHRPLAPHHLVAHPGMWIGRPRVRGGPGMGPTDLPYCQQAALDRQLVIHVVGPQGLGASTVAIAASGIPNNAARVSGPSAESPKTSPMRPPPAPPCGGSARTCLAGLSAHSSV